MCDFGNFLTRPFSPKSLAFTFSLTLAFLLLLAAPARAQDQPTGTPARAVQRSPQIPPQRPAPSTAPCFEWVNAATGFRVQTGPFGWSPSEPDPNHYSSGGHKYTRLPYGSGWVDSDTYKPVDAGPPGWNPSAPDQTHVVYGGLTFIDVPCSNAIRPYRVWTDSATGIPLTIGQLGPPGWGGPKLDKNVLPGAFDPDPNTDDYGGFVFKKQLNGAWVNSATGFRVQTGPEGWSPLNLNDDNPNPDEVIFKGHTFELSPCGSPLTTVLRSFNYAETFGFNAPPPPVKVNIIQPYFTNKPLLSFGLTTGAYGLTTEYDDGYKIGSTNPFIGFNSTFTQPIGSTFNAGVRAQLLVPFTGTDDNYDEYRINALGTLEGQFGWTPPPFSCGRRINLYGTGGLAIGSASSGYGYPGASYSDTESMLGYTVGGGAKYTLPPRFSVSAELDYLHLNSTSFKDPTGSYNLSESGIGGSIGFQYNFNLAR